MVGKGIFLTVSVLTIDCDDLYFYGLSVQLHTDVRCTILRPRKKKEEFCEMRAVRVVRTIYCTS